MKSYNFLFCIVSAVLSMSCSVDIYDAKDCHILVRIVY